MRRLWILYYWFFKKKNNVSFLELLFFLIKRGVKSISSKYIRNIEDKDDYFKVSFENLKYILYWPKKFPLNNIFQITAETFDKNDWHYYQKQFTEIHNNEIVLDIGAAEGLFSLNIIDRCKKIYIVEPSLFFSKSLQLTFERFKEKVEIFRIGVGSENRTVYLNEDSLSTNIIDNGSSNDQIDLVTIDSVFADKKITYMKADIEGYEMDMLKGAVETIRKNRPKIAITSYHIKNDFKEMIRFILEICPDYNYYIKGIEHREGKPVMIHFY